MECRPYVRLSAKGIYTERRHRPVADQHRRRARGFLRPDGEKAGLELSKELRSNGFFDSPSTIVLVSGRQPGLIGATDTIRVRILE